VQTDEAFAAGPLNAEAVAALVALLRPAAARQLREGGRSAAVRLLQRLFARHARRPIAPDKIWRAPELDPAVMLRELASGMLRYLDLCVLFFRF
jgi:hypothetical protein